jgi:hypothetical protein
VNRVLLTGPLEPQEVQGWVFYPGAHLPESTPGSNHSPAAPDVLAKAAADKGECCCLCMVTRTPHAHTRSAILQHGVRGGCWLSLHPQLLLASPGTPLSLAPVNSRKQDANAGLHVLPNVQTLNVAVHPCTLHAH